MVDKPPENRNVALALKYVLFLSFTSSLLTQATLSYYVHDLDPNQPSTNTKVGLVQTALGATSLIAAIPAAAAADFIGRQAMLRAAAVVGSLTLLLFAATLFYLATFMDPPKLYLVFVLAASAWGTFMGMHAAPLEALFGDSIETGRRSRLYVKRSALRTAGSALGPLMSIPVFAVSGDAWTRDELARVMLGGVVVGIIPCSLLFFFRDDRALGAASEGITGTRVNQSSYIGARGRARAQMTEAIPMPQIESDINRLALSSKNRLFLPSPSTRAIPTIIATSDILAMLAGGMSTAFFPIFFGETLGLPPLWVQPLLVAGPLGIATTSILVQRLTLRWGRVLVVVCTRLLGVIFLILLASTYEPVCAIPCFLLFRWFTNCTSGLNKSILNDYVSKRSRARWNILESMNLVTWSGSALLGGYLNDHIHFRNTFRVSACVHVVSVLLVGSLYGVVHEEKEAREWKLGRVVSVDEFRGALLPESGDGGETREGE